MIIADLHIHGKYSRATSKQLDLYNLEKWAKVKGINLLGTGDFTHPKWIKHIKETLTEKDGILTSKNGFNFILQTELSLIYTQDGKGRRIHYVILAPNVEVVEQINEALLKIGRLDYDGRPIFGFSSIELVEMMEGISDKIEIIPAHCLLPDSYVHTLNGMKKINEIIKKDNVLTHKGRYRKVEKVHKRKYSGEVIRVIPACMKLGNYFTPEHPIYSIKSYKTCKNVPHTICKPGCAYLKRGCKKKEFEKYKNEWNQVKDLEKGDIILYPRYTKVKDKKFIYLHDFVKDYYKDEEYIKPRKEKIFVKNLPVKDKIDINNDFCRLIGYYLAEGYTVKDRVCFTFSENEQDYILDVKDLITKVFGNFVNIQIRPERNSKGASIVVHSKILKQFFEIFYSKKPYKAYNKYLLPWFIDLPFDKLTNLLLGWWRGDTGCTSSVDLCNQFKQISIKMGILPSISFIGSDSVNQRRIKKPNLIEGRKITCNKDQFVFTHLSFFPSSYCLNKLPEFKKYSSKLNRRKGWIDKNYIYLPILKINKKKYKGFVYNLEVKQDNSYLTESLAVHNCWTPWFGLLGSKSGFDSVKECFQEKTNKIHALETGLSSNPAMNWRLSNLDKFQLVSFSDLHSFWPWRIGREATLFDVGLSYRNILNAIRTGNGLDSTIEVDPAYGKYHFDGHRSCNISFNPNESVKHKDICPVCNKPLTIGVEHRVEVLADRRVGFKPVNFKPFLTLMPLSELIASYIGVKQAGSKTVWNIYDKLIKFFESELNILLYVNEADLRKVVDDRLALIIMENRKGKLVVKPGYDGVYGELDLKARNPQKNLSGF